MKDLNLVPSAIIEARRKNEIDKLIKKAGIAVGIFLVLAGSLPFIHLKMMESENINLQKKIDFLKPIKEKSELLDKLNNDMKVKGDAAAEINDKRSVPVAVVDLIEKQIPQGIKSYNIIYDSMSGDKIVISGIAQNAYAVADFIYNIRQVQNFSDVFVPSLSPPVGGTNNRTFTFNFSYVEKGEEIK